MKLELIIGEVLAGFIGGIPNGIARDRKINFGLELIEELNGENSMFREVLKDNFEQEQFSEEQNYALNKLYSASQIALPLMTGLYIGLINTVALKDIFGFPVGLVAVALPVYFGGELGEKLSKNRRKKAKLNEKEISSIDSYLENYKQSIIEGNESKITKVREEIMASIGELLLKKRNIKIFKPVLQKMKDTTLYAKKYRDVKNFLAEDTPHNVLNAFRIGPPQYKKASCLVFHNNSKDVYLLQFNAERYRSIQDIETKEGSALLETLLKTEKLSWNGTVDEIMKLVNSYGKENPILLVKGKEDMPLQLKFHGAIKLYVTNYMTEKLA